MKDWLENAPPILLFTGKGGVGKTSLACASSIALSDAGKKVLLVSTDPASNLDEVLNTPLTGEPCAVREAEGLYALNIDPLEAAAAYRERMISPLKDVLPEEALRNIEEQLSGACTVEIAAFNEFTRLDAETELPELPEHVCLANLVGDLAAKGPGVIMTMGKGGVGKTTLAAAIARGLALKGLPVHLSTTDPAAHVADALGKGLPNLTVDRIDPREVTRRHIEQVMAEAGAGLDAQGRALLEEELRSPCTEEVAVFQAFARTVARGGDEFVVLDTAPTGHTLLLLDASEAYHREVLRDQGELPEEVKTLLPKLRDPDYTRVLVVTLPEATPVHEAAALQEDLRRAGIEPAGWIVNQSLAGARPREARLRTQAQREVGFLQEVAELSDPFALVPWKVDDPAGPEGLDELLNETEALETV